MPSLELPPEDRSLSPHTGWTRSHWETVADALLAAVRTHAGPEHALISLPGSRPSLSGHRSDALEGYARTFLLAAFRVTGADGADPAGLMRAYARGLAAGTRTPTAEHDLAGGDQVSWPDIALRPQALVEAASIAVALRLTRPWLWDTLDEQTREQVRAWLAPGLRPSPVDNNWWLFPAMVGAFLVDAGLDHDGSAQRAVDRGLERIEQWYLGDGWYTDGRPRAFDHYNGWALHLYPLLHAHLSGDQQLLDKYGPRLAAHLEGHARTFGADGAPVHQGRSLIYRFAAAAPLWAGALTGHTPLTPGATRRLASGALRYFLDGGAVDADGLLPLGWFGRFDPMVQTYSGPASPYWASKGFLGLLLPADHPVWTAVEEPGPAETTDAVLALPQPGWLIQSTTDGLVRLHNHGSDDQPADQVLPDNPLYARLAHSTATGPAFDGPPDNHFGLVTGGELSERGRIHPLGAGDGWAASLHRPRVGGHELPGVTVTSLVLVSGADEIHAHLVNGAEPGTEVRHSGWAVAGTETDTGTDGLLAWSTAADPEGARLTSALQNIDGFTAATAHPLPTGTAFGPAAALPVLTGRTNTGAALFVSASRLARTASRPFPHLHVHTDGTRLHVRRPDGAEYEAVLAPGQVTVTVRPSE
ncbi:MULTISPECIES: DUF2264 domain-containing protein [unclassified Kitasatospora]|uniref:DUF2264 domain-containing protein n=1 Tax=unclassified Kitasatospora TaxID=2633591 RepID=UPI000710D9D9|nr:MULTISPECIES: DUF2264 domain-containing protein [unclassified Kitasatospora]KQV12419.1 hypothetical protein ASC99_34585 [Kitasatospora sp. Root107]KRB66920.1 hypothetical protein ASE03_30625 [Kitasatospora sp. Root187]